MTNNSIKSAHIDTSLKSTFQSVNHKSSIFSRNRLSSRKRKSYTFSDPDSSMSHIDYGVKIQEFLKEFYKKTIESSSCTQNNSDAKAEIDDENNAISKNKDSTNQDSETQNDEYDDNNNKIVENIQKIDSDNGNNQNHSAHADLKASKHHHPKPHSEVYKANQAREIRGFWGIDEAMYISSLCDKPFVAVKSEGQSGALFFKSADDSYLIKTITKDESKFLKIYQDNYLQKIVKQGCDSLLTKYLEHFKITIKHRKFYMLIMNNLFVGVQPRKYDLKGSTIGRETKQARIKGGYCVFKDKNFTADFKDRIGLINESYERIVKLLEHDTKFLEELKVIDYSLLLGVLKRDDFNSIKMIINDGNSKKVLDISAGERVNGAGDDEDGMQAENSSNEARKGNLFVPPGVLFGINGTSNQKLIIFIQIIDTLIEYKAFKKSEYLFKKVRYFVKMQNDANAAYSVVPPSAYRPRFVNFMRSKVFASLDGDDGFGGDNDELTFLSHDTIKFVGNLTYNSQEFVNYTVQLAESTQKDAIIAPICEENDDEKQVNSS